jgi:glycerophosphoryl diester phosphodiesterase
MAAFRLAAEMGADGVELDVRLCKDGEAVVIHDSTIDKTTDGSGRLKDLTLIELQALDAGSWFGASFSAERIPTLAQVLHEFGPRLIFNIELKTASLFSNELEAEVVRLIEDTNMAHRTIVSSFSPMALWRVRRLNRHISLGLLYSHDQLLHFYRRGLQSLIHPHSLHPRWDTIDEKTVAVAHRQGLRVYPWTCNDSDAFRRLIGWGVDGIITDRPDLMHGILHSDTAARE